MHCATAYSGSNHREGEDGAFQAFQGDLAALWSSGLVLVLVLVLVELVLVLVLAPELYPQRLLSPNL